ncbi:MAG: hypothetical protein ACOX1O_01170 [Eggerthellaceae bacterium]
MNFARTHAPVLFLPVLALALCLCFSLAGCNGNDDQEVRAAVDSQLTIDDDDLSSITDYLNDDTTLDAYQVKLGDYVGTLLQGYTYNIDAISTEGNDATAEATITSRDFSSSITTFDQALTDNGKTLTKLKKHGKKKALKETVSGMLEDALSQAGSSTTSATITIDLTKGQEGWQLSDPGKFQEDWYNAMFGETLKKLDQLVSR